MRFVQIMRQGDLEKNPLRKQVIIDKYGVEDGGWCSREVRGAYGVGVWKAIRKIGKTFALDPALLLGMEGRLAINKDQWVCDAWEEGGEVGSWNLCFQDTLTLGMKRSLYRSLTHALVIFSLEHYLEILGSHEVGLAFLNQKEFDSLTWVLL
ncbi:hypothetical protein CK203_063450 [Vitis vinifera]|uniref:Uncharacterized protein n=1 Tax=Vitis vinifera TaxID=29760 RepID=A0A438FQV1_VITVI|nr:hypothetical protein CK203_063450 [Vitis vinifera]